MKLLCTRGALYFSLALVFVLAAACTQTKPPVPTPTLVPLSTPDVVVPQDNGQPTAIIIEQATPAPGDATAIPPPSGDQTTVPPDAGATPDLTQPTAILVQPTLLPTPTTVGDTGQPVATAESGGSSVTTGGSCSSPYTVKPGEWFLLIARNCGVTPQALQAANPGMNPNLLRPGQVLNIPGGGTTNNAPPVMTPASGNQPPPSTGSCTNPYTVQRGDTLYSIATRCGTTVIAIQQANNIPAPEYIFPGQQLRIP